MPRGRFGQAHAMTSSLHFDHLLNAAAEQPQPQRLLFVFTAAELPADATPLQRQRFADGQGGTLSPLACVDRELAELTSFDELVAESREASPPWNVVFIAGLSGRDGQPPSHEQVDGALAAMVEGVRTGRLDGYMALDNAGELVQFS